MNHNPFWLILCQSLSTVLDHWPLAIQALWIRMHFQVSTRSLLAQNTKPQKQDPKKNPALEKSPLDCSKVVVSQLGYNQSPLHSWMRDIHEEEGANPGVLCPWSYCFWLALLFYAGVCKTLEHQVFFFFFFLKIIFRCTNEEIHCEDWSIKFDS